VRNGERKHHGLLVWQEAMALVKQVYCASNNFPPHEMYALTSQMRRAAVSIPSNIAEGAGRTGGKEFLHFLSISRGSLCELETQVLLATDLGYLTENKDLMQRIDRVFALLGGLMNKSRPGAVK
jgi:four helix bundle protein